MRGKLKRSTDANAATPSVGRLRLAWTIVKLRCVRFVLGLLLKLHIAWELGQRGSHRPDIQGTDAEMEELIEIAKEKQKDDRKL